MVRLLLYLGIIANFIWAAKPAFSQEPLPYRDTTLPIDTRVDDLLGRLTLEEKLSQLIYESPAIGEPNEAVYFPAYNWWSECLHGITGEELSTVFPQCIGLGATWNVDLIHEVANAIADEGRAIHHEALRHGEIEKLKGLNFFAPNINIFRDPRWGRGQETYGEDPYLTSRIAVAFVQGLQGDDPDYFKVIATPKHFAVHSGPEALRHNFDAVADERDMWETYLPAFEAAVVEAGAHSIMTAYNQLNEVPCAVNAWLIEEVLRQKWQFDGYVVNDLGSIYDMFEYQGYVDSLQDAAVLAINAGNDLNLGDAYYVLPAAVAQGQVTEARINEALRRLLRVRFLLGMFDPPEMVPYAQIGYDVVDRQEHRDLARRAAQESIVLLKNNNNILPLDANQLNKIAVIGTNAHNEPILLGNYFGNPSYIITPLEGIQERVPTSVEVLYDQGYSSDGTPNDGFIQAKEYASQADVAVVCLGLTFYEADEGKDLTSLDLPGYQQQLVEAIYQTDTPVIVVLINGNPLTINWIDQNVDAIVEAWFPGQESGSAIADVLFGDYNPAGRLPITFYSSLADVPEFTDYSMPGRTYRYLTEEPLYPFGFGLSYTTFSYSNLQINDQFILPDQQLTVSVDVENTGPRTGDEVVQLYVRDVEAFVPVPRLELQGFKRINLDPNEKQTVEFNITPDQLTVIDDQNNPIVEPGMFQVYVGPCQPDPNFLLSQSIQAGQSLSGQSSYLTQSSQVGNVLPGTFVIEDPNDTLTLQKVQVRTGKTTGQETITISGKLPNHTDDLLNAESVRVVLRNSNTYVIYEQQIDFVPDQTSVNNVVYQLGNPKSKTESVCTLRLDSNRNSFSLICTRVSLQGLRCPFIIEIETENFNGWAQADEDIVNSRKPIPLALLRNWEDLLQLSGTPVVRKSHRDNNDSLRLKGWLTIKDEVDLSNRQMILDWDQQSFMIPPGSLQATRHQEFYVCKKVELTDNLGNPALFSALIDLQKCSFSISITKTNIISTSGNITLGLQFDNFDETVDIILP
ncbi:MAG: glycoside hydrolase family 3 C-terminal domain-containing protein [Sedimentisphaerales bacterium]|nr:glycoside hydrolase family 3 C-terminal domain-containing protein [Sedimentisphaerales bacterium]